MTYNQYRTFFPSLWPTYGGEQVGGIAVGTKPLISFKRQAKRFGCLLAADRRTNQNTQVLWRVFLQPFSHLRGLFLAAGGEFALEVGEAVFGFGVAPE